MKTIKNSRQREAVLQVVRQMCTHPTAEEVYRQVLVQCPNISLATVYRNLNLLSEMGVIKKLPLPERADRFDRRVDHHYHVFCAGCGQLFDAGVEYFHQIDETIAQKTGCIIQGHDIVFQGICKNCQMKA